MLEKIKKMSIPAKLFAFATGGFLAIAGISIAMNGGSITDNNDIPTAVPTKQEIGTEPSTPLTPQADESGNPITRGQETKTTPAPTTPDPVVTPPAESEPGTTEPPVTVEPPVVPAIATLISQNTLEVEGKYQFWCQYGYPDGTTFSKKVGESSSSKLVVACPREWQE